MTNDTTPRRSLTKSVPFALIFIILFVLVSLSAWATTETVSYNYDGTYQLKTASYSGGASEDYIYDASGNRLVYSTLASPQTNNAPTITSSSPANAATGVNMRSNPINWQGTGNGSGILS
jgi:Na+/melibiose symporter-like transporter